MAELEKVLSSEELAEYQAFKAEKARKAAEEQMKADRAAYREVVEQAVERVFPELQEVSGLLFEKKKEVYRMFETALQLKKEIFRQSSDNYSHTFSNRENTKRIILGVYMTDDYTDTVNEGVAIIKEVIEGMAVDANSRALVSAVMRLLAKDSKGSLKASRVLQLQKISDEINNPRFSEGVRIIQESYRPAESKTYVRAEYKNEIGRWITVPLGMTEV
jgi:uncharacterized protein (UPF0147 family)